MSDYDPKAIEPKWQAYWKSNSTFRAELDPSKPKYYVLDMFPYPSGAGLHVGHPEGYTATDIVSRYLRMKGYNVLHPMGWDAFGLPAEQYAVKTNTHPAETTRKNIDTFRRQLKMLGISYDWSREFSTTDPEERKFFGMYAMSSVPDGQAGLPQGNIRFVPENNALLLAGAAELRVALLQVQRHRVDQVRADLVFCEMLAQRIAGSEVEHRAFDLALEPSLSLPYLYDVTAVDSE